MIAIITNFLLFIGGFQLALAGVILAFLAFPDKPHVRSVLTSRNLQKRLVEDYIQRRAKIGGILGILLLLTKSGVICVGLGALLWVAQKVANYLPVF